MPRANPTRPSVGPAQNDDRRNVRWRRIGAQEAVFEGLDDHLAQIGERGDDDDDSRTGMHQTAASRRPRHIRIVPARSSRKMTLSGCNTSQISLDATKNMRRRHRPGDRTDRLALHSVQLLLFLQAVKAAGTKTRQAARETQYRHSMPGH